MNGMTLGGVLDRFGSVFLEQRYLLVAPILIVQLVGLLEKHGLQERAAELIRGMRAATAGRVLLVYAAGRQMAIALGIVIGGQASVVRPLLAPMAEAAARTRRPQLSERMVQWIRANAAAVENVASFFGEDVFVAVGAVLLIKGFFDGAGVEVSLWKTALWGLPTALLAFGALLWRMRALDRRIDQDKP